MLPKNRAPFSGGSDNKENNLWRSLSGVPRLVEMSTWCLKGMVGSNTAHSDIMSSLNAYRNTSSSETP